MRTSTSDARTLAVCVTRPMASPKDVSEICGELRSCEHHTCHCTCLTMHTGVLWCVHARAQVESIDKKDQKRSKKGQSVREREREQYLPVWWSVRCSDSGNLSLMKYQAARPLAKATGAHMPLPNVSI